MSHHPICQRCNNEIIPGELVDILDASGGEGRIIMGEDALICHTECPVDPLRRLVQAEPFEARHCDTCDTWIFVAAGPFAERDRTKTLADCNHYEREHSQPEDFNESASGAVVFGFPYMRWNEEPVTAVREMQP